MLRSPNVLLTAVGVVPFHLLLYVLDLHSFLVNVEPEVRIQAHVLVRYPDQGEAAHQVPTPVVKQQLVACNEKKN